LPALTVDASARPSRPAIRGHNSLPPYATDFRFHQARLGNARCVINGAGRCCVDRMLWHAWKEISCLLASLLGDRRRFTISSLEMLMLRCSPLGPHSGSIQMTGGIPMFRLFVRCARWRLPALEIRCPGGCQLRPRSEREWRVLRGPALLWWLVALPRNEFDIAATPVWPELSPYVSGVARAP
jgi:hypothetical protein